MHRQYYSYNDMPKPKPQNLPVKKEECTEGLKKKDSFLSNIENDDIILAIVIVVLLMNDCDDKLLLLALAFVFISGL